MNWIKDLVGVDIYLIDQLLKNRIRPNSRILDAGCGKGRNLRPFLENGYACVGIDPDVERIEYLQEQYPFNSEKFIHSTVEDFYDEEGFDLIICNAVLHFAKDDDHFNKMFARLVELTKREGLIFIRMTSNIGLDHSIFPQPGIYMLPDDSVRYLITRERIDELILEHGLKLMDPVKSTLVEDLRSMTTIVLGKS